MNIRVSEAHPRLIRGQILSMLRSPRTAETETDWCLARVKTFVLANRIAGALSAKTPGKGILTRRRYTIQPSIDPDPCVEIKAGGPVCS